MKNLILGILMVFSFTSLFAQETNLLEINYKDISETHFVERIAGENFRTIGYVWEIFRKDNSSVRAMISPHLSSALILNARDLLLDPSYNPTYDSSDPVKTTYRLMKVENESYDYEIISLDITVSLMPGESVEDGKDVITVSDLH